MKQTNIDRHNNCQCEIRWKIFKNKSQPTAGLFCRHHDVFLDWLSNDAAILLIDRGIKEAPYLDRKRGKTPRPKTRFYQRAKRINS